MAAVEITAPVLCSAAAAGGDGAVGGVEGTPHLQGPFAFLTTLRSAQGAPSAVMIPRPLHEEAGVPLPPPVPPDEPPGDRGPGNSPPEPFGGDAEGALVEAGAGEMLERRGALATLAAEGAGGGGASEGRSSGSKEAGEEGEVLVRRFGRRRAALHVCMLCMQTVTQQHGSATPCPRPPGGARLCLPRGERRPSPAGARRRHRPGGT